MHRNFYLALIGIGIGGIGFGLVTPVTVMLLEQSNAPSILTGSVTMTGYLSVVIFSGFAGRLIDKINIKKVLVAGLAIWMLGSFAHIFWKIYPLLFPIKFLMGIGGTFIYVSTEVIINYYSDETNRGKNISKYVVLLSAGIAAGTFLLWTIKIADWVPFTIGGGIMLIVLILQILFFEEIQISGGTKAPEKMPLSKMPFASLIASVVYGIFESAVVVALPLFGLRNHFTADEVTIFLASFVVGGIILLYFLGIISDRMEKYKLLLTVSFLLGFLFFLPPVMIDFWLLLPLFFLIGGIVPAFYTLGLNYTVEKVDKKFIAQANGYYIMMYGIGTIAGPLIGSMLVELDKQYGFWFFAAGLSLIYFFLLLGKRNNSDR